MVNMSLNKALFLWLELGRRLDSHMCQGQKSLYGEFVYNPYSWAHEFIPSHREEMDHTLVCDPYTFFCPGKIQQKTGKKKTKLQIPVTLQRSAPVQVLALALVWALERVQAPWPLARFLRVPLLAPISMERSRHLWCLACINAKEKKGSNLKWKNLILANNDKWISIKVCITNNMCMQKNTYSRNN